MQVRDKFQALVSNPPPSRLLNVNGHENEAFEAADCSPTPRIFSIFQRHDPPSRCYPGLAIRRILLAPPRQPCTDSKKDYDLQSQTLQTNNGLSFQA